LTGTVRGEVMVKIIPVVIFLFGTAALAGGPTGEGWVVQDGLAPLVLHEVVHVDPVAVEPLVVEDEDTEPLGRRVTLRFHTEDGAAPDETVTVDLPRGCERMMGRVADADGAVYVLLGGRTRYTLLRLRPWDTVETLLEGGDFVALTGDGRLVLSRDLPCNAEAHGFEDYVVLPKRSDGSPPGGISQSLYQQYLLLDVELEKILEPLWLVSASSYLADDPANCSPVSAIDGDIGTAWVEGVEGDGVGEWLTLELGIPTIVRNVALLPGYCASPEVRRANGRPSRVRFEFSDGTSLDGELEDFPAARVFWLDEPRTLDWLRMTLLDVYPGERWHDTAVSELTVNFVEGY
jgi:hypothetical protein